MKLFITSIIFLLTISTAVSQQQIKSFVKQYQTIIASVENDNNYSGYEAIAKAIGNKRVVMLGEQDHGDAPAFLAKTKLIKYLHEKMGFTVLAFESDFFSLTEGQSEINNDTSGLRKYMRGNIFPIWPYCDACDDLFNHYLPATFMSSAPITVTGFDNQLHGSYTRRKINSYLDSILSLLKTEIPNYETTRSQLLTWTDSLVKNYGKKFGKKEDFENYETLMKQISMAWVQKNGEDYTARLLQSIIGFNNQSWHYYGRNWWEGGMMRDREMAANLDWLVNVKYKNEKIIVWAANGHIVKNSGNLSNMQHTAMGTFFCDKPGNAEQTYILGFTSAQGTAGRVTIKNGVYNIVPAKKNSFETWFGETPFAFIDFLQYRSSGSNEFFLMKGGGHSYGGKQPWTQAFDGIFYIKNMYACKKKL
ncbi:MAG: erythromycin esterase family protein [Chitinophagaceae bacterium]|nr:erythromycin esterase family protein [Chitinophagaceae bacterium]